MFYPQTDRQTREREYTESLAQYSLQGLMAARKQHFLAEHRRMHPSKSSLNFPPPEPLARSTIRSPAHAAAAAGVASRLRAVAKPTANPIAAGPQANIDDVGSTYGKGGDRQKHTERNGTMPNIELQRFAPLASWAYSDDRTSPTSNNASLDSAADQGPRFARSSSGSESAESYGHPQSPTRKSTITGRCAEPTFSIGLLRRRMT